MSDRPPPDPALGTQSVATYAAMTLHVFLAAGTYVFGKSASHGVADPAALTLLRGLGASVLCLSLTGSVIPRPRFSKREWIEVALLGVLLVPMNQYLFIAGLKDTVASHPALIYAMTPVGVLALGAFVDRRAPPRLWLLGTALALAGVLVVLEPWSDDKALVAVRGGDFLILIGLLVWVVYTVWVSRLAKRCDPRTVTVWTLVLGTLVFIPVGAEPLFRVQFDALSSQTWFGIAWLSVITSTVMMLLWNQMLRRLAPVQVAVCANAQPAATALLGSVLAMAGVVSHDPGLTSTFWIGTLLVIAGVFAVQWRRPKGPTAPSVPSSRAASLAPARGVPEAGSRDRPSQVRP